MASISQQIEIRTTKGKKVKRLRREGVTPANIFGAGLESESVQANTIALEKTLNRAGYTQLITLQSTSGGDRRVLVKDIQRDPLTGQLLHVDFHQVKLTDKVRVSIPLVFEGEAPASRRKDLLLLENANSIDVECLPTENPERITIDISKLAEAGDRILAGDVPLDEKMTLLTDPEEFLIAVSQARMEEEIEVVEEEEVEAAQAPTEEPGEQSSHQSESGQ